MKNDQTQQAPQNINYNEIFFQEKEIGEEIPNQWSLKLKKVESILLPHTVSDDSSVLQAVDVKRSLILKKDGKASITFDISTLKKYSICVINESDYLITFCLELSPNNINFIKKTPYIEVEPRGIKMVSSDDYLKYARIRVLGKNISSVIIYLQGVK
ncbi:DUF6385 domain-containing protein [Bacillus massiliigorillae]|uniref:DUF6385 domain-containing protein n=1 Tax=Bacillus massiliigorillae TaxID=1243664 RepID=UPI0003A66523|nr:DUF6385 domain-containing protein [Bacillus massiliigorillae]